MNERLTLAEIDAQCRRATRGAGYAWGLAEEAGKAARWLASYGMPGPEALAALLSGSCPRSGNRAEEGAGLCSLSLGASLSDRATQIADGRGFVARDVAFPLLLLPQAGRAATALETVFVCAWEGFRVVCMPGGIAIDRAEALNPARVDLVECHIGTAEPVLIRPGIGARLVDPAAWEALDRLARNTYVPATAASRQAGAGAGLSDND